MFMRVLQGIGGGALAPISQAILMESFPPKKQGVAQALFGLGVVVAPVVEPVLGGWLTDSYSWRWIFYINVPLGALAIWAIQQTVEDPPWVRNSDPGPFDGLGIIALSLWLGCQEVALDKGQEDDWLSSLFIRWMVVLAVVGFLLFIVRELRAAKPMVELRIFGERNLAAGVALIFVTCVLLYSVGLLTPQFLQQLMGYSSFTAGVATAPLGLGAALSMILVGFLVSKFDPRAIALTGFILFAIAAFALAHITLDVSPWTVFWPQILAGSAIGFLFIPVNLMATASLSRDQLGSATGSMNLMRNVGGSVGIAMVSTFLARRSQVHQTMLGSHITSENLTFYQMALGMRGYFAVHLAAAGNGPGPALGALYRILQQQSWLLAFVDVYEGLGFLAVVSTLLLLALRKVKVDLRAMTH